MLKPPVSALFETLQTVPVSDIIASWKSDFRIDVARLFEGVDELSFRRDPATGRMFFDPPIEGDARFYQALREFDWYHPATKQEFATAARWHSAGEPVLDIGAGACGFAAHVPHEDYIGLETDDAAVRAAREAGLGVHNSDMAAFLASGQADPAGLVTAFQVLEHVADPDGFIAGMVRLARPGGHVAIGVPDAGSYVADLPDFMLNAPPHHLTWWTESALEQAMMAAGLRIKAVCRFEVEPWEKQLWWMAQLARLARPDSAARFGAALRARKVASFLGSWVLQVLPIPKRARGSTLLMIGEKAG